ncbi:DUF4198 domain-containing protein [Sphingosinithalassobacter sp. LHW66-3]|uniref:DUF4198 domain-containing protein n=1 Tax=Sphingosinithalassobacter sp. LHW66-3 TaxID=3424718 RepID=UPI003D6BAC58
MKLFRAPVVAIAAVAAFAVPAAVEAHRIWMLPSSTVLSGDEAWVTIDAAVSNELFYFNHQPLRGDFTATAPDGTAMEIHNLNTGRFRSTFDVHLTQQGTHRVGLVREGAIGSYMLNGERQRLPRGFQMSQMASLPAGATDVQVVENHSRTEAYLTLGAPTATLFQPTGKGIELVPVTHPNDLYADEPGVFRFLLDGQPAANLEVTIVPGGSRYRDEVGEMHLTTDAQGEVTIAWPQPGMYWMNLTSGGGDEDEGTAPARRASYAATLEVLAP